MALDWRNRPMKRWVLITMAFPTVLFVFGLFTKNAILLDSFRADTWLGMSMAKLVQRHVSPDDVKQREGNVSRLFQKNLFQG